MAYGLRDGGLRCRLQFSWLRFKVPSTKNLIIMEVPKIQRQRQVQMQTESKNTRRLNTNAKAGTLDTKDKDGRAKGSCMSEE